VYLPRLDVLKNNPNFDQGNNVYFNQVEGFDKIIDNQQTIFTVPVSSTTGWGKAVDVNATFTTDSGTTITANLGADPIGAFYYSSSANNILESDRYTFQIKSTGTTRLNKFSIWSGNDSNYSITYTINGSNGLMIPASDWLTVDVPFISGTVAASSSVYISGTRYGVAVSTGSNFNYISGSKYYRWTISGNASGNKVYLRNLRQYKSIEWSVRRVDDYNEEYICLDCVRTAGRDDKLRRAYNDGLITLTL
jgi:hypothetical protein